MIQASELRINNIVLPINPRHNEKYIVVESVSFDRINLNFREYGLNEIDPIPLTEEWLKKFGFSASQIKLKQNSDLFVSIDDGKHFANDGKAIIYIHGAPMFDVECLYVHQLQNLYFALCGEELTIKP